MTATPGYKYCPRVDRLVSTGLSEGQCRDLNCCRDDSCSLEARLGERSLGQAIRLLASSFAIRIAGADPNERR